ncbi:MAG: CDP-alcohol phosphatidyltransferase family protein, partial [Blastochloris sp.]|nr:CDP-alcohol phosphatidyltransferase family protein [Blastochloris sp.]
VGLLIESHWFMTAMVTFVIAASTDFIDGWWARRFNQITKLGRILDPFNGVVLDARELRMAAPPPAAQLVPPPTITGWWEPGGAEVEVDPQLVYGAVRATCPRYPGLVWAHLRDGTAVWLTIADAQTTEAAIRDLPPAGGVCEVQ